MQNIFSSVFSAIIAVQQVAKASLQLGKDCQLSGFQSMAASFQELIWKHHELQQMLLVTHPVA